MFTVEFGKQMLKSAHYINNASFLNIKNFNPICNEVKLKLQTKVRCHFFFFNLFIYFNWRLITLQYCGSFCDTLMWISRGCTCVRHPKPCSHLPPHPSGLSQCSGFECPVSCIELGLVIYFTYGNIYVSMLFSQIVPPSPSPTESKSLFFISVSLLLSHI